MKLIDLWKHADHPTLSFELFPAKTAKAAERLENAITDLAALLPDFASVTFGAGGSTRTGSYQLLEKLKVEHGLEVLGYFAGYGLGPGEITAVLDSYQQLGIDNILVQMDTNDAEGSLAFVSYGDPELAAMALEDSDLYILRVGTALFGPRADAPAAPPSGAC